MNYSIRISLSSLILIVLFQLSCDKDDTVAGKAMLAFVENSVPEAILPAQGGTIYLDVDWAFTKWNIKADVVLEGAAFIERIDPTAAGATGIGSTQTKVKITLNENKTNTINKQQITLRSSSGEISKTLVITQAGKTIVPVTVAVDPNVTYQTIAGFGGGNTMWGTNYLTPAQIRSAFGTGDHELGLTIFRVRLSPVKTEWPSVVPVIKEAKKYGAQILASPWSPPASMKSNNDLVRGHLLEENYAAYATYLNDFVQYMASEGAAIDAVSIQNEPDWSPDYESCEWTPDQVYNFIKNFAGSIEGTKVAAAESLNFKQSYTDQILNDATAVNNLDIVAGHIYGGGLAAYPLAEQKGKEIWMTEYLLNLNSGTDPGNWDVSAAAQWDESMLMLKSVHTAMVSNWNAYIWWYIRRYYSFLGDGEHNTTLGEVLKRGYAMSHYAKFVRPGYIRIGMQMDNSTAQLSMTAYKGDNKIVVVMINAEANPVPAVNLTIPEPISVADAYTTSLTMNCEKQALTQVENKITIDLPPLSVTTVIMGH